MPPHFGSLAKVRRLKRQALALAGEQRLQLGQRRTCLHRDDQLARLITDHAAQARDIQHLALQRFTVKVLAAAAPDAKRCAAGSGLADAINEGGECAAVGHGGACLLF
jgi:hypothetical protein